MLHLFGRLKKYLLILLLILVTGCKAEYNITINDTSNINESLDIIENDSTKFDVKNSSLYNSTLREYLQTDLKWPTPVSIDSDINPIEPVKIDQVSYYNKIDNSTSDILKLNYSYKFNAELFNKSRILRTCYNYELNLDNNILSFKTKDSLNCYEDYSLLEEVTFNLNTTCKILDNNADKVNKNKLTWKITKDNYSSKNISFSIDCSLKKQTYKYEKEVPILLICFGYIFILLVVVLLVKILYKKNNKL